MTEPKPIHAFPAQHVHDEGAHGATIRWVITEADGSHNYALRVIELEPHGNTPHHTHWFEHQNYVVEGEGEVTIGDTVYPVKAGDALRAGRSRASVPQHRRDAAEIPVRHPPAMGQGGEAGSVRRLRIIPDPGSPVQRIGEGSARAR